MTKRNRRSAIREEAGEAHFALTRQNVYRDTALSREDGDATLVDHIRIQRESRHQTRKAFKAYAACNYTAAQ